MAGDEQSETKKMQPATVVELAGLVSYSTDSIVSRTLFKNESGSVTVFSFDAGQSLSEHTAPYDALVSVLDGQVELVIGGKTVQARAGQIVLMPAHVPHAVQAKVPFKMMLTMLRSPSAE